MTDGHVRHFLRFGDIPFVTSSIKMSRMSQIQFLSLAADKRQRGDIYHF